MCSIGQVVYSKSGRDKRRPFIVVGIEGDYLYLADGDLRKISKPKKKKIKHVQTVSSVDEYIKQKIEKNAYITDADFRKALESFKL